MARKQTNLEKNAANNRDAVSKRIRERAAVTQKKERFITWRMWADMAFSLIRSDRGAIPRDIADRIYIGNNVYMTKNSLTSTIAITELSTETPTALASDIIRDIKNTVPECSVDVQFKNYPFEPDLRKDGGILSRIRQWENVLDRDDAPEREKQRAARLLYSHDILSKGIGTFQTAIFIHIRAKNAGVLKRAVKIAMTMLHSHKIDAFQMKAQMPRFQPYILTTDNTPAISVKDIPRNVMTSSTLAQSLPITQGVNSDKGVFMGIDEFNGAGYYTDFKSSSAGKTIYLTGLSGVGKTFLAINWCMNAYAEGYGLAIMDVKGNEFTPLARACGGKVLSMRDGQTSAINSLRMVPEEVRPTESPESYYKNKMRLTKAVMEIVVDAEEKYAHEIRGFLDAFLQSIYMQCGVEPNNTNTWHRTDHLSWYTMYNYFLNYLSQDVKDSYVNTILQLQMTFSEYFSRGGSESAIFASEFDVKECRDSEIIVFDYGLLNSARVEATTPFKIRNLFMNYINDDFILMRKYNKKWTIAVLEEIEAADDTLMQMYKESVTLRRAQNQVTILLGNSTAALRNNPIAQAIMENMNIFVIGKVHQSVREFFATEFGLENYANIMRRLAEDPDLEHRFLFVDQSKKSTAALLSVQVPEGITKGKLFRNVDTVGGSK